MIKTFDRNNIPMLRSEIETALKAVEAKFGISIIVGSAKFRPDNVTFKFDMATIGQSGQANTPEREAFKRNCFFYGLKVDDLDKEITYGGTRYVVRGLATRRPKFPIVAERVSDGKPTLLTAAGVKNALALAPAKSVTLNPPAPVVDEDEAEVAALEGAQV